MQIESWAIPAAALVVAVAGFAFTYLSLRQTASTAYIQQLERRVEHLESELKEALRLVQQTRDENVDLLRRLLQATGGRRDLPT